MTFLSFSIRGDFASYFNACLGRFQHATVLTNKATARLEAALLHWTTAPFDRTHTMAHNHEDEKKKEMEGPYGALESVYSNTEVGTCGGVIRM